jgi:hypothetical protein
MGSQNKVDVADWKDSPAPRTPEAQGRRLWSPMLTGVLGTLFLHASIIQSLDFGGRAVKVSSQLLQSATYNSAAESDANNLVLITLAPTNASDKDTLQNVVSALLTMSNRSLSAAPTPDSPPMLDVDSLTLGEEESASPQTASGNAGKQTQLIGIYTGQILARIDRLWKRPRTPVDEDAVASSSGISFQCEAQIVQDPAGYVQEILLPRCNGSPAWQHSLVTAIRQASPLPAPPDPGIFKRSITLKFVGLPYIPGSPDDEYEIVQRRLAGTGPIN